MSEKTVWIIEQAPIEKPENWLIQTANTRINIGATINLDHALLFAASPRMLEALRRMVKYPEAADGTEAEAEYKADLAFAKAAIAAAEGE